MQLSYMMERNLGETLQVRVSRKASKGVFKVSVFHKPSNLEDKVDEILFKHESSLKSLHHRPWFLLGTARS